MARRYRFVTPARGMAAQARRFRRALGRDTFASRTLPLTPTAGFRSTGTPTTGRSPEQAAVSEAWALYNAGTVPELKYLVFHLGNALSMCRLVASDIDPETGMPTGAVDLTTRDGQIAARVARDIAGGPAGQAQLLRACAGKLTVAGRVHIAVIHERGLDALGQPITERWLPLSDSEIATDTDGRTRILTPEGAWYHLEQPMDSLTRVWVPNEEVASRSDSLVLGSLDLLNEISLYGQIINSRNRNALLVNGIVRFPAQLQVSMPQMYPDVDGNESPAMISADPRTMTELVIAQAVAAADDPASIEASMPIFVQDGSIDERVQPIEVVDMAVGVTGEYVDRRAKAVERWIGVTDIPREAIEGYGSSNRWNAWYTGEQFVTMHVHPLATVIADGLTARLFRDTLRDEGHSDPESVTLWADTSGLSAKPDRSEAAKDAVDRGAISHAAYRRYLSFTEDDDWNLDTPEGRRDFARWLVARNETALADPTIAEWVGMPAPIAISARTATSASGDTPAAGDTRSTPDTRSDAEDTAAGVRRITPIRRRKAQ